MKIPWGTFKGKQLREISSSDLLRVSEEFEFSRYFVMLPCYGKAEHVCVAVDEEWRHREKYGEHWEE